MPKFEIVSLAEAEQKASTGKKARIVREYMAYLEQVTVGNAGRLTPAEGETAAAIRRRLGSAAKLSGREIVIKRKDDEVLFWDRASTGSVKRKRGRPRKVKPVL